MSLPDALIEKFRTNTNGNSEAFDALHEILADVVDSVRLSLTSMHFSNATADEVVNTVNDYIANHYGED